MRIGEMLFRFAVILGLVRLIEGEFPPIETVITIVFLAFGLGIFDMVYKK